MKTILIQTLLLVLISLTFSQENTETIEIQEGQCARNPFILKLKNFAQQLKEDFDQSELADELDNEIQEIIESDGNTLNLNEPTTDFCSEFDGQNSCCTQNLIDHLPFLIKSYVRRKNRESRPKVKEFLKIVTQGVGKCGGRALALEYLAGDAIETALKAITQCAINQMKAQTKFLMKNTCTICLSSDDLDSSFQDIETENPKLKVSQESIDKYDEGVTNQFKCQRKVFNIFAAYTKYFVLNKLPETLVCKILKNKVISLLDGETMLPEVPENCKDRAKIFEEGCLSDVESSTEQQNADLTTSSSSFRILQSSDSDFVIVSDRSAYNLYQLDDEDDTLQEQEDLINVVKQEEEIENSNTNNTEQEDLSLELDIVLEDIPEEGVLSPGDEGYVQEESISQLLKFTALGLLLATVIL